MMKSDNVNEVFFVVGPHFSITGWSKDGGINTARILGL